jgi:hypothetical protein
LLGVPRKMRGSRRNPLKATDPMPFGQFKGKPMGELPMDYLDFLLKQTWLRDWRDVYGYVMSREKEILAARPQLETPKTLTTYEDYLRWGRS